MVKRLGVVATNIGIGVFGALATVLPASAVDYTLDGGAKAGRPTGADGKGSTPSKLFGSDSAFQSISNIVIFLVGAVAVLALLYGGFRYVTSTGDAKRVESAKNTIQYAVIGIVVAILAFAIVNFIVGALAPKPPTP